MPKSLLLCSAVAVALATSSIAYAQAAPDGSIQIEEIIVTAQKREQRLIDVPAAVTAISGESLANQQIANANSLDRVAPSITIRQGTSPSASDVRIRGVGTSVFSNGVEPSVSFVLDGVVQARQAQGFGDLADVERVEILRGPQGTLFGKNATAGVINVVTARPSNQLGGRLDATVAQHDEYRLKGTVTGPLTDTLRGRLSGYYNNVGGHITDTTLDRKINGYESFGFRGKLDWEATPDLTLNLIGEWGQNDADCCSLVYVKVINPDLARILGSVVAGPNNRATAANRPTRSFTTQWQTALQADLDLGAATLTSITAYQQFRNTAGGEVDLLNTPRPLFLTPAIGQLDVNDGGQYIHQFSQEVRLASRGEQRLNYVVGAFYMHLDLDNTFFRRIGSCTPGGLNGPAVIGQPCAAPIFRSSTLFANTKTENVAAFGQVDLKLIGGLSALAGLRVQNEHNSYSGTRTSPAPGFPGDLVLNTLSTGSGKTSDSAVTGKIGAQYRFSPDAQAYVTWTRGYKGAAYGVQLAAEFANQRPVDPETVEAWEAGLKLQTSDRRFGVDVALFDQKYSDLQVQANRSDTTVNPPIINNVLTNAGSARSKGIEIEAFARPTQQLTLRASATLLDTSLNITGLNCPLAAQAGAPIATGTPPNNQCYRLTAGGATQQNVRDGKLPNAPDTRITFSARYEDQIPGTELTGFAQIAASYQSSYNFAIEQDPNQQQDGYTIVDASAGLVIRDRYRVTVFVKNLFNEHYLGFAGNASALTTATLTPGNLYGIVPKEANRYGGITVSASF